MKIGIGRNIFYGVYKLLRLVAAHTTASDEVNTKNQSLLLVDGVAIISIVLFHSMGQYGIIGPMGPIYIFIKQFLSFLGLTLFSFSSGYKLIINHNLELKNKLFLKRYIIKRFLRLYKPYISYTLLISPLLYIIIFVGRNIFNLDFLSPNAFENPIEFIWKYLIGENPVAYQLWYLVMLLEVTFFCLLILYLFNIDVLFGIGFIIGFLSLFFPHAIGFVYLSKIIEYGLIFIIGMFFATKVAFPKKIAVPMLMPILVIGSYSFYIYLFQWPFLIPIPGRILTNILHIHSTFIPIFLTIFTIAASIIIAGFMKAFKINVLFE